ncbi:unnamed protein product [Diatraea saccharalis]|uniref:Major facilitator superfamily (MFS) profile domain-containing protein n=1 Tax=Diatraea saccharalis TaxID=40085 RepID=A0A9N9RAV0_9NEOP|nr:unnamed protein product [Diatraea saccharalis]
MSKVLFQVLSALILYFSCLNVGVVFTWPSSTFLLFKSDETPLHRPMVESELSLLGSFSSIGALVSNPLTGLFLDRLGRKRSAIITAGIGTISWGLIAFSNSVEVILGAVFLAGISGSVLLVVPVYIVEFSDESIRGALTSGSIVFYGVGMLVSYMIGGLLSYKVMVYICLTLSMIGVMILMLLKESPTLLMKKGMEEEAKKSLAFYTNSTPDSKVVLQEIMKIKRALAPEELEVQSPEEEKLTSHVSKNLPTKKLNFFQFFKKSKSTQRGLLLALTLMTTAIFQGLMVVIVYANPLFVEAVPEEILSATWCSVILAAVSVVFGIIAAYLTDLIGRRTLIIVSSVAAGFSCIALGTQIHLHWGPQWLTAVFIYLFCATYTCGAGTVPFVLLAELFLPEVKSIMSMIVMEWTWICNFIILFIFNPLVAAIGLGPVFYIFAAVCFGSAIYCVLFMPETKGLTVDAIQLLFVKRKRDNVI